jgi:alkylation response protein AidB-like acyl-CoA dehydrogenase
MLDSTSTASTQFTLDADQIAVRDTARAFAAEVFAPNAIAWDEAKHFPVAEMRKAAALGMGGIFVAEDLGGSGLSRLTGTLIFEALATGCPTTSAFMSIHNMVAGLIDMFGSDEQRRRWLPKLCAMDLLASYCLSEPGAGSDAAALATRAVRDGDNYALKGRSNSFRARARATSISSWRAPAAKDLPGFPPLSCQPIRRHFPLAPTNEKWAGTRSRRAR